MKSTLGAWQGGVTQKEERGGRRLQGATDDLAHQLGTGELVGVAPHCRHREGQLVVLYTAPSGSTTVSCCSTGSRAPVTDTLGLRSPRGRAYLDRERSAEHP